MLLWVTHAAFALAHKFSPCPHLGRVNHSHPTGKLIFFIFFITVSYPTNFFAENLSNILLSLLPVLINTDYFCLFVLDFSPTRTPYVWTHEPADSADPRWEQPVMRWCPWSRPPRPPPQTPCALSVASSTGQEKTTYTTTRVKWTTTLSATFAFSPCCSPSTHPVDTRSATSASETSYKRKISAHWTARDFISSCVRNLASWSINFQISYWFCVRLLLCAKM